MIYRKQEHVNGCGLACVAMVTGQTYSWIRDDYDELFGSPEMLSGLPRGKNALEYGTDAQDIHKLLKHNSVDSHKKLIPFQSWDDLPRVAILAVNYRERPPMAAWHWVVFDMESKAVYDPWLRPNKDSDTNIRTDYKRMRPKYYIGVNVER